MDLLVHEKKASLFNLNWRMKLNVLHLLFVLLFFFFFFFWRFEPENIFNIKEKRCKKGYHAIRKSLALLEGPA